MTDIPALWAKATAASATAVVAAIGAAELDTPPLLVSFLLGSGGLALVAAVFAYGRLHERVEYQKKRSDAHDDALKRIEAKLDEVIPQLAVVKDRTEGV